MFFTEISNLIKFNDDLHRIITLRTKFYEIYFSDRFTDVYFLDSVAMFYSSPKELQQLL